MAVQYLVDLGADVTVFDRTEEKRADAARMGATRYVNVNNPEEMKGLRNTFDFIISTIPANYEPIQYVAMLKMGGEMAISRQIDAQHSQHGFPLPAQGVRLAYRRH